MHTIQYLLAFLSDCKVIILENPKQSKKKMSFIMVKDQSFLDLFHPKRSRVSLSSFFSKRIVGQKKTKLLARGKLI